jgi:hypothetical protein
MAVGGFARWQTFCATFDTDAHSFPLVRTKNEVALDLDQCGCQPEV